MPPKRKAGAAPGRPTKRIASGVSTPVSIGSDDEYSENEEYASSGKESAVVRQKYDSQWPSPSPALHTS